MQAYSGFKKKKSAMGSTLTIVALLHVVAGGGLIWLASTATGREMLAVYKINILNLPLPEPEAPSKTSDANSVEEGASPSGEKAPAATPSTASPPAAEVKVETPPPEPSPTEEASAESPAEGDSEAVSAESPVEVASLGSSGGSSGEFPGESPGMEGPGGEGGGADPSGIVGIPSGPIRLPGSGNPFGGGSGGRGGGGGGRGVGRKFSGYSDIVTSEIQKHYKQPADLPGDVRLAVLFQLRLDEEGRLVEYKLMRSSGNPLFDESALRAISNIKQLRRPPQGMSKTLTVKFFPPTG